MSSARDDLRSTAPTPAGACSAAAAPRRAWLRAGATPAYPFGHGLGYTTWTYERIQGPSTVAAGEDLTVQVQLRNTGPRVGKQVVQVYLSRPGSSIDRPAVWLAGYGVTAGASVLDEPLGRDVEVASTVGGSGGMERWHPSVRRS